MEISGVARDHRIIVASRVARTRQIHDLELTMLDAARAIAWHVFVDESEAFDAQPVMAWTEQGLMLAWARGTYPDEFVSLHETRDGVRLKYPHATDDEAS